MTTQFDSGRLLTRGTTAYADALSGAVWNARKPERFPAAILRARTDEDVSNGVRYAVARGMRVSIRSGGHSWIGSGVRDDALMIDLSEMDDVTIDKDRLRATTRPAVRGHVFNELLAAEGLVFPSGHCPSVGLGGFLLGGGYGWNSRALGPACFSIEAIDVVLADGELVHADDESHPDLLWAVRGAGPGFFGIVTRFYLRVYPAYDQILRSSYVFAPELRDEVLAWSYDTVPEISPWLEMSAKVSFVDGADRPTAMLTAAAFCTAGAGPELFAPIESAPFIGAAIRKVERVPSTLADMYGLSNALTPPGYRYSVDGVWTDAPVSRILELGGPVLDSIPTPMSFLLWMLWGEYAPRDDACWSAQGRLYFSPNAVWSSVEDDLPNERWAHAELARLDPISQGTQFADANPADRPAAGLTAENRSRLETLRARYDGDLLFHSYLTPAESTTALALAHQR